MSRDLSVDNSISFDTSPSKSLAKDLTNFHISSPLEIRQMNQLEKKGFKEYQQNVEFSESKFLTHIEDENVTKSTMQYDSDNGTPNDDEGTQDNGYLQKLQDWSKLNVDVDGLPNFINESEKNERNFDYSYAGGTVNRRNDLKNEVAKENNDPPQWKQHMLLNNKITPKNKNHAPVKDPQSDLIISTSLSDISGIPTNTFKNHSGNKIFPRDKSIVNANDEDRFLKYQSIHDEYELDISRDFEQDPIEDANLVFQNMMNRENKMHNVPILKTSSNDLNATNENIQDMEDPNEFSYESKNASVDTNDEQNQSDPRILAHNVFNGLLKNQKTVFGKQNDLRVKRQLSITNNNNIHYNSNNNNNNSSNSNSNNRNQNNVEYNHLKKLSQQSIQEHDDDHDDSSFLGEDPSPLRRNSEIKNNNRKSNSDDKKFKENKKSNIPLIKPEDIGYVFNHGTGAWEEPKNMFAQDFSNSRIVDNITVSSNASDLIDDSNDFSKSNSTRLPLTNSNKETDRLRQERINRGSYANVTDVYDTSIDTPKLNPIYLLKDSSEESLENGTKDQLQIRKSRESNNESSRFPIQESSHIASKGNLTIGNVTAVSQIYETSFHQTKSDLVSTITNVMAPIRKESNNNKTIDWNDITKIDLSNLSIESAYSMDHFLPNLIELDLSNNKITSLVGLPESLIRLNISNNDISDSFFELSHLPNLEELNISGNKINFSANLVKDVNHLRKLNMSGNRIEAIDDLGASKIIDLNLSNNKIKGTINFEKFIKNKNELKYKANNSWKDIEEVNLEGNDITEVTNLIYLKKLRVLIIDNNPLKTLKLGEENNGSLIMENLRFLSIKHINNINHLSDFNMNTFFSPFIKLRVLKIDSIIMTNFLELKKQKNSNASIQFPQTLETIEIVVTSTTANRNNNTSNTDNDKETSQLTLINEIFKYLPNTIREMKLNNFGNELNKLPKNFNNKFPILKILNLQNNGFKSIYRIISRIPNSITNLNLKNNTIINNCNTNEITQIENLFKDSYPNLQLEI